MRPVRKSVFNVSQSLRKSVSKALPATCQRAHASLTDLLAHLPARSCTYLPTYLLTHRLTRLLTCEVVYLPTYLLTHSQTYSLTYLRGRVLGSADSELGERLGRHEAFSHGPQEVKVGGHIDRNRDREELRVVDLRLLGGTAKRLHACMHICMQACMCMCVHLCVHVCMHACMYACMHVHVCVRARARACACMHVRTCMHAWVHTRVPCMPACMPACLPACSAHACVCVHVQSSFETRPSACMHMHMHVCVHVHTYLEEARIVVIHIHMHMHMHMHVHTYLEEARIVVMKLGRVHVYDGEHLDEPPRAPRRLIAEQEHALLAVVRVRGRGGLGLG